MTATVPADWPVISAWTAISPFGYGREAFAAGVRAGASPAAPAADEVPEERACTVPDFSPRAYFGIKGTRAMNRVSGLTVAATKQLLADIGVESGEGSEDVGFVLGTTTGSAKSMMDLTRASLTGDKPDHVEPAAVPGCVMNGAAGQAAIWHGLKGPNATIAAGRTTGLQALNYARRLLSTGRASQVLCGAAEEYSSARSWLEFHRRNAEARVMGEGCVMLLLEPAASVSADRTVLATLVGSESRVCLDDDLAGAVSRAVKALLDKADVAPSQVWAAVGSDFSDAESLALRGMFGDEAVDRVPSADLIGDTSSASALFQIVSVLSVAAPEPDRDYAVVTACDDDGSVACALLRLRGNP
jgi:3-oxoacyl-(acyl-carrier-protein) synthase